MELVFYLQNLYNIFVCLNDKKDTYLNNFK